MCQPRQHKNINPPSGTLMIFHLKTFGYLNNFCQKGGQVFRWVFRIFLFHKKSNSKSSSHHLTISSVKNSSSFPLLRTAWGSSASPFCLVWQFAINSSRPNVSYFFKMCLTNLKLEFPLPQPSTTRVQPFLTFFLAIFLLFNQSLIQLVLWFL